LSCLEISARESGLFCLMTPIIRFLLVSLTSLMLFLAFI